MSGNTSIRQRGSLVRRNKTAILLTVIVIVLLSVALAVVNYFVGITVFEDTDGTSYHIKSKDGAYGLYEKGGDLLPKTDDGAHFVTNAGTLVAISEAGAASIYAVLDTAEGEDRAYNSLLVLPYTPRNKIKSIEAHNEHGTYTVYRTGEADNAFAVKGFEDNPTSIDPVRLAALVVSSGYVVSNYKITEDKVDLYGYDEYGLEDEVRVDADGKEYNYSPAYYKLTDLDDNVYTVLIGDEIPQGNGYYVRVLGRKAVYVTNETYVSEEYYSGYSYSILAPVEEMVKPGMVYPMTATNYYDVKDFLLARINYDKDPVGDVEEIVGFTYWPESERTGTEYQHQIYKMMGQKAGYYANTGISEVLYAFYDTNFRGVKQLGITKEGLETYGLDKPAYMLSFQFPVENPDTGEKDWLQHLLLISELTPQGSYYVASDLYDQIVEVDLSSFIFLLWPDEEWIDPAYFQMNIMHCSSLEITSPDYSVVFHLDNSASQPEKTDALVITASVNGGNAAPINVDIFKKFYQTLLYASLEGPADNSEEERAAIEADPARHQLTVKVKTTLGNEFTYSFYSLTGLKSHSVINGSNDFYVLTGRVNKIIADAERVVRGEAVDPTGAY